jgi:hypothetical protein
MPSPASLSFSAALFDRSIIPWSSFAEDIFRRYGLIFGAEVDLVVFEASGMGSSYVANGVGNVLV